MLNAFNFIPKNLYEAYNERECKVPWTLLWNFVKVIPYPDKVCADLLLQGL